jgi:hypothetical protein
MNDPYLISDLPSWLVMPSVTSSQGSEGGVSHFDLPDGRMIGQSGQDLAHANLSARQAGEQGLLTSGTYGRTGSTLSEQSDLSLYLVSRLKQRLTTAGSILFKMTWKEKITPSHRALSLLRASARPTSDTDYGSWPTTMTRDWKDGSYCPNVPINGLLGRTVWLKGWSSPTVTDAKRGIKPPRPWDTGIPLTQQVGMIVTGSHAQTGNIGQLNPDHSRWLMGYPIEWDESAPMVMPSYRKSRRK